MQLMLDEYMSPFGVDRLDTFFVSHLLPDFEGYQNDFERDWRMNWSGFDQSPTSHTLLLASCPFDALIDSLTEFTISLPCHHPERAPNDRLAKAASIFSRQNAERLIGYYFRNYSPHTPVLHPGTFNINSSSTYMLAVVLITGALFSPCGADVELARGLIGLVDAYVYTNSHFQKLVGASFFPEVSNDFDAWQGLQAVLFMSSILLREGSLGKKRELRNHRFEEIISAVRALGLLSTQNPFFHGDAPSAATFRWDQYGDTETKIRLVSSIFNLDASFTILYNMTPRLFAEELELDASGPLEAFFAENAQDCYEQCMKERLSRKLKLCEICEAFLQEEWDDELQRSMMSLSILNLFVLILAMGQILWLSPYRPRKTQTMERMGLALQRWKQIWDHQIAALTSRQQERTGFFKSAAVEFWQIAVVLTKKRVSRLDLAVDPNLARALGNSTLNCGQIAHVLLEYVAKNQD